MRAGCSEGWLTCHGAVLVVRPDTDVIDQVTGFAIASIFSSLIYFVIILFFCVCVGEVKA